MTSRSAAGREELRHAENFADRAQMATVAATVVAVAAAWVWCGCVWLRCCCAWLRLCVYLDGICSAMPLRSCKKLSCFCPAGCCSRCQCDCLPGWMLLTLPLRLSCFCPAGCCDTCAQLDAACCGHQTNPLVRLCPSWAMGAGVFVDDLVVGALTWQLRGISHLSHRMSLPLSHRKGRRDRIARAAAIATM